MEQFHVTVGRKQTNYRNSVSSASSAPSAGDGQNTKVGEEVVCIRTWYYT